MINLKELITKYPECLESSEKLRSYLKDLYPNEKARINIIVVIFACGIAEIIRNKKTLSELEISNFCNKLENDYGYAEKLSRECIEIWINVYSYDATDTPNKTNISEQVVKPKSKIDKIKLSDGSVYEGETKVGKPHGKGRLITSYGDTYEGEFIDGEKTGKGKIQFSSGGLYEGDLVCGVRTGKGKYIWSNGDTYEGEFINGKMSGAGKLTTEFGIREGEFIDAEEIRLSMQRKKTSSSTSQGLHKKTIKYLGSDYTGETKNSIPHGKGKMLWHGGYIYEGDFVDGQRTGKGKMTKPNGDIYEGEYKNGIKDGKGKYTWANGDTYEGEFINGKMSGTGKLSTKFGVREGKFVDAEAIRLSMQTKKQSDSLTKKGSSIKTLDVASYEGMTKNGMPHGKGKQMFTNGDVYEGNFVNGKRTGKGKYIWVSGNTYEGEFVDDIMTGKGKCTFASSKVDISKKTSTSKKEDAQKNTKTTSSGTGKIIFATSKIDTPVPKSDNPKSIQTKKSVTSQKADMSKKLDTQKNVKKHQNTEDARKTHTVLTSFLLYMVGCVGFSTINFIAYYKVQEIVFFLSMLLCTRSCIHLFFKKHKVLCLLQIVILLFALAFLFDSNPDFDNNISYSIHWWYKHLINKVNTR